MLVVVLHSRVYESSSHRTYLFGNVPFYSDELFIRQQLSVSRVYINMLQRFEVAPYLEVW